MIVDLWNDLSEFLQKFENFVSSHAKTLGNKQDKFAAQHIKVFNYL